MKSRPFRHSCNRLVSLEKPLRHFYDPKSDEKYLTDFPSWATSHFINPKMDHVTWALHAPDNPWSFDQGLRFYKAAMEAGSGTSKPSIKVPMAGYEPIVGATFTGSTRENMFAASFRALGQTLHGFGDLCVPAHVRNDSHPGYEGVGGTDPIEGNINFDLTQKILEGATIPFFSNQGKTVEDLMKECAIFTNENFFRNDTICNENPIVIPRNYAMKTYSLPKFSASNLVENGTDTFEVFRPNSDVILAERSWVTTVPGIVAFGGHLDYSVPFSAAEGQAGVLLPFAVGAGAEAIDLFFPTMKLTLNITEIGKTGSVPLFSVSGELAHQIASDPTWAIIGAIRYNGEGELQVNGTIATTVTFVDGIMNPITEKTFNDQDKVQLIVKAGALIHKSEIIPVSSQAVPTTPTTTTIKTGKKTILSGYGANVAGNFQSILLSSMVIDYQEKLLSCFKVSSDGTGLDDAGQMTLGNYSTYASSVGGYRPVKYAGSAANLDSFAKADSRSDPYTDKSYSHDAREAKGNSTLLIGDCFYFNLSSMYGVFRITDITSSDVLASNTNTIKTNPQP